MTALDQAFIKAYKHQGPADRFSAGGSQAAAAGPDIGADQIETQIASTVAKLNDVMAALEKPSGKMADTPAAEAAAVSEDSHSAKNKARSCRFRLRAATRPSRSKSGQKRKKKTPPPTLDELDVPEAIYRLDPPSPTVPDGPASGCVYARAPAKMILAREHGKHSVRRRCPDRWPLRSRRKAGRQIRSPPIRERTRRFDSPQGDAPAAGATGLVGKGIIRRIGDPRFSAHAAGRSFCLAESLPAPGVDRRPGTQSPGRNTPGRGKTGHESSGPVLRPARRRGNHPLALRGKAVGRANT